MSEAVEKYLDAVARFRREFLAAALTAHGGNRSRTARSLGIQRTYLLRLIREFELPGGVDGKPKAVPDPPVQVKSS